MRKILLGVTLILFGSASQAVTYTPSFADYTFPGSQYDVDAPANNYFETNYGINVDRMYLYTDSRDTFDGIGIANGWVSDIPNPVTGTVDFVDGGTDFVTFDYLIITGHTATYSVFDTLDTLLDTITLGAGTGTSTLNTASNLISYLTLDSNAGFAAISGLTYDFDGTFDGSNNDLSPVPLPAAAWLFGSALLGFFGFSRRKANA